MPLVINTNTLATNAQTHLSIANNRTSKSMEKLASGFRINRAGDDAAGIQVSERLRAQIRGSEKARDNVLDAINMLNVADGALQTIEDNLQRMRELAVQGANDTYGTAQRSSINQELNGLAFEISRIAMSTQFNGRFLLNGSITGPFRIQVGANQGNDERINIQPAFNPAATLVALSQSGPNPIVTTNAAARATIGMVDTSLRNLNTKRGLIGAYVNQLEAAANNLSISVENQSSTESRIRNVDIASESAELTRNQILQNSASTVLAQSNQAPSIALQLLGTK